MPRTNRDTRGNSAILIATTTFWTDALVSAIRAIASRIGGMDIKPSMTRMIMAEGRALWQVKPYIVFFPAIFLSITVLAVNLLGDGLRDALDPRLAKRI